MIFPSFFSNFFFITLFFDRFKLSAWKHLRFQVWFFFSKLHKIYCYIHQHTDAVFVFAVFFYLYIYYTSWIKFHIGTTSQTFCVFFCFVFFSLGFTIKKKSRRTWILVKYFLCCLWNSIQCTFPLLVITLQKSFMKLPGIYCWFNWFRQGNQWMESVSLNSRFDDVNKIDNKLK